MNLERISLMKSCFGVYRATSPARFMVAMLLLGLTGGLPAAAHQAAPPSTEVQEAARLWAEAEQLFGARRYDEAAVLYRRVIEIRTRTNGPDDPSTLGGMRGLARLYREQRRFRAAAALYRDVIAGNERRFGANHSNTLQAVGLLARLYQAKRDYRSAQPMLRRIADRYERDSGPDAMVTLTAISELARNSRSLGNYREAENLFGRLLASSERVLGPEHAFTMGVRFDLAGVHHRLGNFAAEEAVRRRTFEINRRIGGPDHAATLSSANNLGLAYQATGRGALAEPLLRDVLTTRERILGRDHEETLGSVSTLARLYWTMGRFAEAEALYLRGFEDSERRFGRDHRLTREFTANLGRVRLDLGRYADASSLLSRAVDDYGSRFGRSALTTLVAEENLALARMGEGQFAEARRTLQHILEMRSRELGADHPTTLFTAQNLVLLGLREPSGARHSLAAARQLVGGLRKRRALDARSGSEVDGGGSTVQMSPAEGFVLFADAAWANQGETSNQHDLRQGAFIALQDSLAGRAERSVAEQAARRYFEGRDPALAALTREWRQLLDERSVLETDLAIIMGSGLQRDDEAVQDLFARLAQVSARIEAVEPRLRRDAPEYFDFILPVPLDIAAAQRMLGADDAFLLVVPGHFGTHVVAVTTDNVQWHRSGWNADRVRAAVQRLRWDVGARFDGTSEEQAALAATESGTGRPSFDRTTAHILYRELVAPVRQVLGERRRIYIAAGGSLAAIPFNILVSETPSDTDNDPAALRATRWFGDEFALVHIPSIQSLAAFRRAPAPGGARDFVGIGDPVLAGASVQRDSRLGRSGLANVRVLRDLPRLEGTATELERMRVALGARPEAVHLGTRATETAIRGMDLSEARILTFATHGLMAGEAADVVEPGLVLTPPPTASENDDGYLAASEVVMLRLDADWVILSACNTATGEAGSPGLGNLARAFLYAGARNLLASHWPVSDEIAPVLTVRMLELERSGVGRAEAFHQAMREVRMDASRDTASFTWAHPAFWAPFVLIGDGGR